MKPVLIFLSLFLVLTLLLCSTLRRRKYYEFVPATGQDYAAAIFRETYQTLQDSYLDRVYRISYGGDGGQIDVYVENLADRILSIGVTPILPIIPLYPFVS